MPALSGRFNTDLCACVEIICIHVLYMCAYVHIDVSTCSGQMSVPVVFLNCSGFFFFWFLKTASLTELGAH